MTAREIAEVVWNERGPRPGFVTFVCLSPEAQEVLTNVAQRALETKTRRKRAA